MVPNIHQETLIAQLCLEYLAQRDLVQHKHGGYTKLLFNNCAFKATTIVLILFNTAPTE